MAQALFMIDSEHYTESLPSIPPFMVRWYTNSSVPKYNDHRCCTLLMFSACLASTVCLSFPGRGKDRHTSLKVFFVVDVFLEALQGKQPLWLWALKQLIWWWQCIKKNQGLQICILHQNCKEKILCQAYIHKKTLKCNSHLP